LANLEAKIGETDERGLYSIREALNEIILAAQCSLHQNSKMSP
jgi:hypothetical protein